MGILGPTGWRRAVCGIWPASSNLQGQTKAWKFGPYPAAERAVGGRLPRSYAASRSRDMKTLLGSSS